MAKGRTPKAAQPPPEATDVANCLALVNTLSARRSHAPSERLTSYAALVEWARESGLVRAEQASSLALRAGRRPAEAAEVLRRARELRELLYAVLEASADRRRPPATTLDGLAEYLAEGYGRGRLVPVDGTLQWICAGGDELDGILWELTRATARLVSSSALSRVRACGADDCAWWFVDDTKNQRRRWCDMKTCGNRDKVRRFRARQR